MAGVAITRMDLSASELRAAAKVAKTPAVVRRILTLALVLEGVAERGLCWVTPRSKDRQLPLLAQPKAKDRFPAHTARS